MRARENRFACVARRNSSTSLKQVLNFNPSSLLQLSADRELGDSEIPIPSQETRADAIQHKMVKCKVQHSLSLLKRMRVGHTCGAQLRRSTRRKEDMRRKIGYGTSQTNLAAKQRTRLYRRTTRCKSNPCPCPCFTNTAPRCDGRASNEMREAFSRKLRTVKERRFRKFGETSFTKCNHVSCDGG